ncbi:prohead peptidase. Unknown type peptidase. MEROPS family U35 [Clostridium acidisoli DSM 12555]|uniref:Prohead serine protease domain-containing protein n=1 Tax=Clostridium acidisoli DSM 12555 TaxID=1121291 RepID=A0A1W1X5U5_9CLOT|nr:HK97 family phage prohead protease [Clostridium acidisoli]SMC19329.1 prohead peptidase. Unknown type peptidase. MEROPS family U35 [Clostridium acidisoli DSM 12555]
MQIEIRNDSVTIKGYVNALERDSRALPSPQGKFVEQVRTGTWKNAIAKNDDIAVLLNHDWNKKLGSTKDNLKLKEDNIGLYAEARVCDADVIEKAKNNELCGWSFGFKANKQSWGKTDNEMQRRYLDDIDLFEVSILDNTRTPAYYGTSVEARDNEELCIEQRFVQDDIEVIDLVEKLVDEGRDDKSTELAKQLRLLELELEL